MGAGVPTKGRSAKLRFSWAAAPIARARRHANNTSVFFILFSPVSSFVPNRPLRVRSVAAPMHPSRKLLVYSLCFFLLVAKIDSQNHDNGCTAGGVAKS